MTGLSAGGRMEATPTGIASVAQTMMIGTSRPSARQPLAPMPLGGLIKKNPAAMATPASSSR